MRTTPGRLPNRESGPQNQPIANVAVFVSVGALASMGGISGWGGGGASPGIIFSLPAPEARRIAPAAIPARVTNTATPLTFGRVAWDLFLIAAFQGRDGLLDHMLDLRQGF